MKSKNKRIDVLGTEIVMNSVNNEDYISLTDIARYKDNKWTDYIIQNWLRNRNNIKFLGILEKLKKIVISQIKTLVEDTGTKYISDEVGDTDEQ